MRYRVTLENGATGRADDVTARRILRQAADAGCDRTRVRGGWVVTLPGGGLVALLRESTYAGSASGVVLRNTTVS